MPADWPLVQKKVGDHCVRLNAHRMAADATTSQRVAVSPRDVTVGLVEQDVL